MAGNLATTNLLLGIMAMVSVLEALLIIGVGVAAFVVYRRVVDLIALVIHRDEILAAVFDPFQRPS